MRKKLALFLGAIGLIIAGLVAFLAFESYTLDINAHLEPVLQVNPHGDWDLGTVYPETSRATKLFVGLSNSAQADENLIGVLYNLDCQSKTGAPEGAISLCPHIQVGDQQTGALYQCPQPAPGEPATGCKYATPALFRNPDGPTLAHGYLVSFQFPDCEGAHQKEPDVKEVDCNPIPGTQKFAGVDLEAQISVQVLDIAQEEKCIVKKDGTELPDCVKLPADGTAP